MFPFINKPKPSTPGWEKRHPRTDSSKCCCMRVITWFHLFRDKRLGLGASALLANPTLVEVKMDASRIPAGRDRSSTLPPADKSFARLVDQWRLTPARLPR